MSVLAIYLLLTIILTYPLVRYLTTHIPGGDVDESGFLWNMWWIKHSLLDLHTNPLVTNIMFYPLGMNLTLNTMLWLSDAMGLPLTLTAGPVLASNVLYIIAFMLSGFGMYLLALDMLAIELGTRGRVARLSAFVAGILYAFASARFIYSSLGHYNFINTQWLPLTILFILRTVRRPGWRSPLLAGIFAVCAGLSEFNLIVYLALFLVIYFAYALLRQRSAVYNRRVAGRLALALAIFLAGFGVMGLAILRETLQGGDYLVTGWGGADRFVIDLLGPLVPSPLHTFVGQWAAHAARSFSDINFGFIGYLALVLVIAAVVIDRRRAEQEMTRTPDSGPRTPVTFWLAVALIFFVLSLGPLLHINGQSVFDIDGLPVSIPLPYIIIHYLPILKGTRVPGRFGIMATLAVAMLLALVIRDMLARLRSLRWQAGVAAVVAIAIILGNISVPLPLSDVTVPEPYQQIAAQPGDFSILQIPLGWREGFGTLGRERTLLQSYQREHGKLILAGQTARSPAYVLPYFRQLPVIGSIAALEEGQVLNAATLANDRAMVAEVLGFLDLRYVVVEGDYIGGPVDEYIQSVLPVRQVANGSGEMVNSFWHLGDGGKWVETRPENADWVLYAMDPSPVTVSAVNIGGPDSGMYLPAGWSRPEEMGNIPFRWVNAQKAEVLMRLDQAAAATLVLHAAPFSYTGAPTQRMAVSVNGHSLGTVSMQEGWQEYRLAVPASALQAGINRIWLEFAHQASPAKVLGSSDERSLSAAFDWIRLQ